MDFVKVDRNLYYEVSLEYSVEYDSPLTEELYFNTNSESSSLLTTHEEYAVPITVLKGNSSLSAIVTFLKNKGLSFKKIADLTNRDQRTIWCTYNDYVKNVKKSNSNNSLNDFNDSTIYIPIEILRARQFSVLESIVFYLKQDCDLTLLEISEHLGKNYQTIYTVYRRAMAKNEE